MSAIELQSIVVVVLIVSPFGTKSIIATHSSSGLGDSSLDRLELVIRNTEEIVKLDELRDLLEKKQNPRAYVGYETSGKVHLGHMLTVNKLLDLQKTGFDVVVLL
ncbi:MAG: hypothetical protein LUQ22_04110, partial [Methanotrichaceae archaeon]|nr:hypothetical protein [Methanotrichaceae archaeon]